MSVGPVPEGVTLNSLSDSYDVRGEVELEVILNKRWGSRLN